MTTNEKGAAGAGADTIPSTLAGADEDILCSAAVVRAADVEGVSAQDEADDEAAMPVKELVRPARKRPGALTQERAVIVDAARLTLKARKRAAREEREAEPIDVERPKTYADCKRTHLGMPGNPCPFVQCTHNLLVEKRHASLALNRLAPDASEHPEIPKPAAIEEVFDPGFAITCAVALSPRPQTLEAIGDLFGISKEAVRIAEDRAIAKLRAGGIKDLSLLLDYWSE